MVLLLRCGAPLLLLLLGCALEPPPFGAPTPTARAWLAKVDAAKAGAEAVEVLQSYLRVDTSNPPGNETLAAQHLQALLAADAIPSEILEFTPGRGALVARLDARDSTEPPLCLMHHMDVATAEPAQWPADRGPFSGARDGAGFIWGRGALDMKGLGVLQLQTLRWLKRLAVPLKRSVVLLGVPDEEVDNQGMAFLLDKHWDKLRCGHVLNEGGMGIQDMFFPGQTVFTISVAEKGVLWVRMVAHGESGHGSVETPGRAPARLLAAVERVKAHDLEPAVHASYPELLARVGLHRGGWAGWLLPRPALTRQGLVQYAQRDPMMRGAVLNTVQVTGFGGAKQPNVVPSEVYAQLDIRLLPGVKPEDILATLKTVINDDNVTLEVLHQAVGTGSDWEGDPLFAALAAHAVDGMSHAVAAPVMGPLYSDSVPLRARGVKAYGFTPFVVGRDQLRSMHGKNERAHVDDVARGLRVVLGATLELVAANPP